MLLPISPVFCDVHTHPFLSVSITGELQLAPELDLLFLALSSSLILDGRVYSRLTVHLFFACSVRMAFGRNLFFFSRALLGFHCESDLSLLITHDIKLPLSCKRRFHIG
jgi:hypothetical protein